MNDLENILNRQQLEGVLTTEGPVLILAGAGSGKTRVLTHRIAYLIREKEVPAYRILAITFTNKAAGEMKKRITDLCGIEGEMVWASTFHSMCARILRRFADQIGYDNRFAIYDTEDSKTVMKEVIRRQKLDPKKYKERYFLNKISSAKNELITPDQYAASAAGMPDALLVARVYRDYQKLLLENNAMDFDDLLVKTVELFDTKPEVLGSFQERFRYIMVDEYQDTNTVQFRLIAQLSALHRNLCVVGDDDQSIYKFRGANIRNILDFEKHFHDAKVIRLEQNYRSVQKILDVANSVISHNAGRKEKQLWTENQAGERVVFKQFDTAREEALFISTDVSSCVRKNRFVYRECAVLYRTNAQSRILEEQFIRSNIPYRIVGGVNFYGRKEIKDILAYLKTMDNPRDDLSVKRIINVPKRGIGATTIGRISDYAIENSIGFYEAVFEVDDIPGCGRSSKKLKDFSGLIEELKSIPSEQGVSELIRAVIKRTGYVAELKAEDTPEARGRIENIDELISKAVAFDSEYKPAANESMGSRLSAFLEEVALVADIDRLSDDEDYVVLMTLHSAKGLEFDNVYLSGLEDGLFPSFMSLVADDPEEEIEEERRLFYVGVTRAKKRLVLTASKSRMIQGEVRYSALSRFLREIPKDMLEGQDYEPVLKTPERKREVFRKRPAPVSSFVSKIEKKPLDFGVGDHVSHAKFGIGEVNSITDGGRDYEVEVVFEDGRVRKMFASFAKLTKV